MPVASLARPTRSHEHAAYERRAPESTDLHRFVRENLEPFLQFARDNYSKPLPCYVERELRRMVDCGVLARGFTRWRCPRCGQDLLVPFSCKTRLCSSCCGRRMAQAGAHLVARVLPDAPIRQWVLTVPFALRRLLAANAKTLSTVIQDRSARNWSSYKTLVGDVNADGRADLIWNSTGEVNRVYVALGRINGRFDFVSGYQDHSAHGWSSYKTLVGDVNADGRADLIWNSTGTLNRTYVALGQLNGGFTFAADYQDHPNCSWGPYKTLVGDVNGDRRTDIIWNVTTASQNRVYVGLNR